MADHLDLITRSLPGFSHRALAMEDASPLIISRGFKIREVEFESIYGLMLRTQKRTYIYLNSLSDKAEKTVSFYHEIYHALAEPDEVRAARTHVHNKTEWKAEGFALACVIPRADAERMTSREIAAAYGVRLKLARLRKLAIKHFDI